MDRTELEVRIERGLASYAPYARLMLEEQQTLIHLVAEAVQPGGVGQIDWGPPAGLIDRLVYMLGGKRGRQPTLKELTEHEELLAATMSEKLAYRKKIAAARQTQQSVLAEARALRGPSPIAKWFRRGVVAVFVLCFLWLAKSCFKC